MLIRTIENRDPAYFRGLQRLLCKRNWIFVVLDDVNLFAAQFPNDGLHAHTFHPDTSAYRVHILVFGHHRNLGALARFASNSSDHHRPIINFWHFRLLHQFRSRTRDHDLRPFRRFLDTRYYHAHPLADGERLQSRLLLAGHSRFGLTYIENHIWPFDALHGRIHDLAHAPDVLVIDSVALSFAHLLEDDLLRKLRGDAPQNSFRDLGDL